MRVRTSSWILGCLLAGLLCGLGCSQEPLTHIPYAVALDYRSQNQPRLLRPGWRLTEVARRVDRPTVMVHRVQVIPELAGDLVLMGKRRRRNAVGDVACPEASHAIWQQLSRRQDVEVDLATDTQGVFSTVSCRAAVF